MREKGLISVFIGLIIVTWIVFAVLYIVKANEARDLKDSLRTLRLAIADSQAGETEARQELAEVEEDLKDVREAFHLILSRKTPYWHLVVKHSTLNGLDPHLVDSVIAAESGYNPRARSSVGAIGLMQIMPGTGREQGGVEPGELYDPETNILVGTRYLSYLMNSFDNVEHALAAYNAGPSNVHLYGGIPPFTETRNYVEKVMSRVSEAS